MQKTLSIIIVSYNVSGRLKKCLESILASELKFPYEIIVIDNNSSDDSVGMVGKNFSKVKLLVNDKNLGFTKAVNQGINASEGNFILLVNPDVEVLNKAIEKIVSFVKKNPKIGVVGAKFFKPGKKEIHGTFVNKPNFLTAVFEFTNLKKIFPNNRFFKDFYYIGESRDQQREVFGLSGGFMLIKRECFDSARPFDENFFMYLEDVDFCLRVKSRGYGVVYYPQAEVIHYSGSSSMASPYKINVDAWKHSKKYFFRKHMGFVKGNILPLIFLIDEVLIDIKHFLFPKCQKREKLP